MLRPSFRFRFFFRSHFLRHTVLFYFSANEMNTFRLRTFAAVEFVSDEIPNYCSNEIWSQWYTIHCFADPRQLSRIFSSRRSYRLSSFLEHRHSLTCSFERNRHSAPRSFRTCRRSCYLHLLHSHSPSSSRGLSPQTLTSDLTFPKWK